MLFADVLIRYFVNLMIDPQNGPMKIKTLITAVFLTSFSGISHSATNTFYDTLTNGRTRFDNRITELGGTLNTDKLTGLASGVNSWARGAFTITAPTNRSVSQTFVGSSASDNDGFGISMTAATLGANTPGSLSASGLSFNFNSPINAFAVELEDWATCCHPTKLYISFDDGAAILVGSANNSGDNPGFTDGQTTFIAAIEDSATFSKVTFWGEAAAGDALYGGNVIRWSVIPIGAISGLSTLSSSRTLGNTVAYGSARVIDATSDINQLFQNANLSTDSEISNAVSQTLPLLTGGSVLAVNNSLGGMNRVIQARLHTGMSAGDGFALDDRHVWLKPFGSWVDQNDRNGVSGFEAETWGVVGGIDGVVNNDWRLGMAFGYANTSVDSNSRVAPQSSDIDIYQLIGYGSKTVAENTEINFQIDFGQNKNDGNRTIAFTNTVASSSFDSEAFHVGLGLSHQYPVDEKNTIVAAMRADYSRIENDAYTETGAGLLNLSVNEQSTESMVLAIDGKLIHKFDDSTDISVKLGVGYDTINEQASITAAFAGAPTASFVTNGIDPEPWMAFASLGFEHQINDATQIRANYDAEYREDFLNQTASVNLRWAF